MKNQHTRIKKYRDLTKEEIDVVNEIKEHEEKIKLLIDTIDQVADRNGRWLAIARTDLQKGFMALVRSIAQPE